MTHRELEKIVNRVKKGDDTAFAKLYSNFVDPVFYLALRIVKNQEDANDIVQETFIRLYNSIDYLDNPITITRFINKITYNTSLNFLRDNKGLLLNDADLEMNIPEVEDDFIPEEYMKKKETRDTVIEAIDALSESQRSVIIFFYYQNLSISEIAEIMDISEQAVKNRLFRARKDMKKTLLLERLGGALIVVTSGTVLARILSLDAKASDLSTVNRNIWEGVGKGVGFSPQKIASLAKTAVQTLPPNSAAVPPNIAAAVTASVGLGRSVHKIVAGILVAATVGTGVWVGTHATSPAIPPPSTQVRVFGEITQGNLKPLRYPINTVITAEKILKDAEIIVPKNYTLETLYMEDVNVKTYGEYGVYLHYINNKNQEMVIIPIIIIIQK